MFRIFLSLVIALSVLFGGFEWMSGATSYSAVASAQESAEARTAGASAPAVQYCAHDDYDERYFVYATLSPETGAVLCKFRDVLLGREDNAFFGPDCVAGDDGAWEPAPGDIAGEVCNLDQTEDVAACPFACPEAGDEE